MKRAFIIDLDNTVYPVKSIGHKLFAPLFQLIKDESDLSDEEFQKAMEDIMRKPFQKVADEHKFSPELRDKGIALLRETSYEGEICPFPEYKYLKEIPVEKFLVTTGFQKLQRSKIERMGIAADFREIFIVDPESTAKTKKDIFQQISDHYGYSSSELLVIGDDPDSEIKAARELGIETFLLDSEGVFPLQAATYIGRSLKDVPGPR